MTKADQNLAVIQNFILHVTHSSMPTDGVDEDFKTPMTFTPEQLYQMADEYIEEDHVDGRDNSENNIVLADVSSQRKLLIDFCGTKHAKDIQELKTTVRDGVDDYLKGN